MKTSQNDMMKEALPINLSILIFSFNFCMNFFNRKKFKIPLCHIKQTNKQAQCIYYATYNKVWMWLGPISALKTKTETKKRCCSVSFLFLCVFVPLRCESHHEIGSGNVRQICHTFLIVTEYFRVQFMLAQAEYKKVYSFCCWYDLFFNNLYFF